MANTVPETQEDNTPATDINAEGAPTPAENTPLSNEQATVGALEVQRDLTSDAAADAAEEEALDDTPDIKAAEAKEAAPPHVPETVQDFVTPTSEHLDAKQTVEALDGTGATVVGEAHPTHNLGETVGEFNGEKADTKGPSTIPAFNAITSGKYGNGEGEPLDNAVKGRWKILKWAKIPKLFGGQKVNEAPAQAATLQPATQTQGKG